MLGFEPKGAIFDVDDTLLDNKGKNSRGLHERSRFEMVQEIGRRHDITAFKSWTYDDNYRAFHDAPTHSLLGALWNTLVMTGLRKSEIPDPEDPLVQEMIELKMRLHEKILLEEGKAYPGAVEFVKALALKGLKNKLAVATTAHRRDIDIFFAKTGLHAYFPSERVITIENSTRPKPDPESFNLAFATLGLPESDRQYVCAFEDNPRGIKSAQAAGLYVCALSHIFSRKELVALEPAPQVIADDFYELAEHFDLNL